MFFLHCCDSVVYYVFIRLPKLLQQIYFQIGLKEDIVWTVLKEFISM